MFLKINDNWTVNLDATVAIEFTDKDPGSELSIHLSDGRQVNAAFPGKEALSVKELMTTALNLDKPGDRTKKHREDRICELFATATIQVLPP